MTQPLTAPLESFPSPDLDAWHAQVGDALESLRRTTPDGGRKPLLATEGPGAGCQRTQPGWTVAALATPGAQARQALEEGAEVIVGPELVGQDPLDLGVYQRAGAHGVQELGYLAASLDEDLSAGARDRWLIFEVGGDLFEEVAKLRAARLLWHRVHLAHGAEQPPRASFLGLTSWRTQTRREPMNNVLRATTQAFAAVLGGVDALAVRPHEDTDAARRLAIHLQHVLAHEAHLGRSADPTAGSYLVETRTDELARAGWQLAREISAAGGMAQALEQGDVQWACEQSWRTRSEALLAGEAHLLGVNLHPAEDAPVGCGLVEPPLVSPFPARRDEEVLEGGAA
jgi:methylmalonyl-CoA mutase N-terminal domain/subunit